MYESSNVTLLGLGHPYTSSGAPGPGKCGHEHHRYTGGPTKHVGVVWVAKDASLTIARVRRCMLVGEIRS